MAKQYIELGTLILALVVLWLLLNFIQNPIALVVNSIFALALLLILNFVFRIGIPITVLTILIVAIGGVIGLLLILLFRFSNIAFYQID